VKETARFFTGFFLKAVAVGVFMVGMYSETGPVTVSFVLFFFIMSEARAYAWFKKRARIQELWATQSKSIQDATLKERSAADVIADVVGTDGSTGSESDPSA